MQLKSMHANALELLSWLSRLLKNRSSKIPISISKSSIWYIENVSDRIVLAF